MSVIGPRPQLVRDMTFMTKEQGFFYDKIKMIIGGPLLWQDRRNLYIGYK